MEYDSSLETVVRSNACEEALKALMVALASAEPKLLEAWAGQLEATIWRLEAVPGAPATSFAIIGKLSDFAASGFQQARAARQNRRSWPWLRRLRSRATVTR